MVRQRFLAVVLVIAWILIGAWQWSVLDAPKRVPLSNISKRDSGPRGLEFASEWALERPSSRIRESPSVPKRNLFAVFAGPKKRSVPSSSIRMKRGEKRLGLGSSAAAVGTTMPVVLQGVEPSVRRPPVEDVAAQASRVERDRRQRQLADHYAQYRLLGFADHSGVKQAFIGKGTDIYIVRQGDMLGDMFVVSLIAESGVKVRDIEYGLEQTMQLKPEGGG
ncbi:MAG: hypothetical protein IT391_01585 [Nitrospira sp.]|nr:hypothetical protein [Nitrospira sp.]